MIRLNVKLVESPEIKVYLTVTEYMPEAKLVPNLLTALIVICLVVGLIVT